MFMLLVKMKFNLVSIVNLVSRGLLVSKLLLFNEIVDQSTNLFVLKVELFYVVQ